MYFSPNSRFNSPNSIKFKIASPTNLTEHRHLFTLKTMSGISNCSTSLPLPDFVKPPTNVPYFAIENLKGIEDTLKSCCGDSPVSNYENNNNDDFGAECFSYCNITSKDLTGQKVYDCVSDKLKDVNVAQWNSSWVNPTGGATSARAGGVVGYLVFGLVLSAAMSML